MNFFKKIFYKPHIKSLTVTSSSGFHLRPAAQFVTQAKNFNCDIFASFQERQVSAKSVNTLLSLNLDKDDSFTLICQGNKAQDALAHLSNTFDTLMTNDTQVDTIEKQDHDYTSDILTADIISTGIAIAPLYRYEPKETYVPNKLSFTEAVRLSDIALEILSIQDKDNENTDIFLAQRELLLSLSSNIETLDAFENKIIEQSNALKGGKLASKNVDFQDILRRVKEHLGYSYTIKLPSHPFIIIANDLLPSDIEMIEQSNAVGVILQDTSTTSHTSILLRASGMASLIINNDIPAPSNDVILDAYSGTLLLHPKEDEIEKANDAQRMHEFQQAKNHSKRFHQAFTSKDIHIDVHANISDTSSAQIAKEQGADGIGLLRTEFLFTQTKPSLEEQEKAYAEIFALFEDITVRTLDIGGDKQLPYIQIPPENNPFLGIRGVRLFKSHPEILEEQLHAIFKASKSKPIKIMFPMISTVEEFNDTKSFAIDVAKKYAINISHILFGMMIEVPSVLFNLTKFDEVVDFYSVGTNDLTQYLFAIERTHPTLQADTLSPEVFTVLERIVNTVTKPVSICGELASNTDAIPRLVQMGYKTLSVTGKSIPQTKETIRHV